jgi:hypothetical protein
MMTNSELIAHLNDQHGRTVTAGNAVAVHAQLHMMQADGMAALVRHRHVSEPDMAQGEELLGEIEILEDAGPEVTRRMTEERVQVSFEAPEVVFYSAGQPTTILSDGDLSALPTKQLVLLGALLALAQDRFEAELLGRDAE